MDIEHTAYELNRLHIDHAKLLSKVADALSSNGETGVMLWLNQQDGEVFAVDIIEHFGLTPGRVANIVKKLEEKGYIQRRQSYEDLRKSYIRLTDSGSLYTNDLYKRMNANHLQIIKALGEEDTAHAMRILQKIISFLDSGFDIPILQ